METISNPEVSNKGANLEGASIAAPLKSFIKAPEQGFRLSRHIAKKDKSGKYEGLSASLGIIVPASLSIADCAKFAPLARVMVEACEQMQDKLIRSKLEKNETTIQHSEIDAEAVSIFAASLQTESLRLNAENIGTWFAENVSDAVTAYYLARVGITDVAALNAEQRKEHEQMQNNYKGLFQKCSVKAPSMKEAVKSKLIQMLDLAEVSDVIGEKVRENLEAKEAEVDAEAL